MAILSTQHFEKLNDKNVHIKAADFLQTVKQGMEKSGIITDVLDSIPVFHHRPLAEYLAAKWLCDNFQTSQTFMRDHLFELGFGVVRNMVHRILADKCPLHQAVINSNTRHVARMLKKKQSIAQKEGGGRTLLHIAVSCSSPQLIRLILEHGADGGSVDTLLGLSPVQYAIRMVDSEVSVESVHKYGWTLIQSAAANGHVEVVRELLKHGNRVESVDNNGWTPLH
jgi:hypothetical protein